MLRSLTVRGFKSIRALDGFEVRALNVLVGANEAGKSNLLEALRLLGSMADGSFYRVVSDNGGPDGVLTGGRRATAGLDVEVDFNGGRYGFRLEPDGGRLLLAREELTSNGRREVRSLRDGGNGERPELFPLAGRGRVVGRQADGEVLAGWPRHHFCDTGALAGVRREQEVRDNLALKPDGSNLGPFLRWLSRRHGRHYRDIVESIRLVAPAFGDFVDRPEVGERMALEWAPAGEPKTVCGPERLSDGVLRFMCLATLLNQPEELQPGVVLIDEPELGLDPRSLTLVAEMLRGAAENRQVVVSTQSADLVNHFEPEEIVVVNRELGATTFERQDAEDLAVWLEEYSLGELWKANIIGGPPAR